MIFDLKKVLKGGKVFQVMAKMLLMSCIQGHLLSWVHLE